MAGSGVNMEQFELYFQRADLDRDGRISGAEAVGFFQGSNLPKQVLAQIWMHADQNRIGYLSRPEFFNALKLVTVAQSKRELTPEIVKAALYGPASAKIPPPQINLAATPVPQPNPLPSTPPQAAVSAQQSSHNFGFRGMTPSNTSTNPQFKQAPLTTGMNQSGPASLSPGMNQQFGQGQPSNMGVNWQAGSLQHPVTGGNQQFGNASSNTNLNQQVFPVQGDQTMKSSLPMPTGATMRPPQIAGGLNTLTGYSMVNSAFRNSNSDRDGVKTGMPSAGPLAQGLNRGLNPSIVGVAPNPLDMLSTFSSTSVKDTKTAVGSGTLPKQDSMFGGDVFSISQSSSSQVLSTSQYSMSNLPAPSVLVPGTYVSQSSAKADPFEALQSSLTKPSLDAQVFQAPLPKPTQHDVPTEVKSSVVSSVVKTDVGTSISQHSQVSWPKMTCASIQKYTKVFLDVDTDKDGIITGEQARNLFMSWRLPREVLKQVWDLSDQDNDSSLSLREFCIALYLMERYREGHTLPSTLPHSVMLDETLLSLAGPPTSFGNMGWSSATGFRSQPSLPGAQPITPVGVTPSMQQVIPHANAPMQVNQKNVRGSGVASFYPNQLRNGENFADTKGQEETETNEKDGMLLDSKEKLVFYQTKMQDLVLYKSRCDNRLNEITERARADKGEAELLENKFQEKYKHVSEIYSKLTIEEASFREVQARKMELHQAIIKIEQGGSTDGILQVRADRIQSDLEELLKALIGRCTKHSIQIETPALIELPTGWQPGIPEEAAIWDEDWDKFEDDGFSFHVDVLPNDKPTSVQRETSPIHASSPDSVLNADSTPEKYLDTEVNIFESGSIYSVDGSKSPQGSPRKAYESPSHESSENYFTKSSDGDAEHHRSFDEPTWGNFDSNEDIDSIWGSNAKEMDNGKHAEKYFFGSNDFDANQGKTDFSRTGDSFQDNSLYAYEDSIPGTPPSRSGNSHSRYSIDAKDPFFDSFSRYGSFSRQDDSSSPPKNLSRFDSVNSTGGFDHSRGFSFDDSDPFGSVGPFKVSSETPKKSF